MNGMTTISTASIAGSSEAGVRQAFTGVSGPGRHPFRKRRSSAPAREIRLDLRVRLLGGDRYAAARGFWFGSARVQLHESWIPAKCLQPILNFGVEEGK